MFAWTKRITLFFLINFAVMLTLSLFLKIFGIQPYLQRQGIQYQSLLIFCLLWGMGGSFISLLLSKKMATWSMGVQIIDPKTRDPLLKELVDSVHALADKAGLPHPDVGIYSSPEVNAFATGASKSNSLVAVSSGLMQRMAREERLGVLGHELAHISNGDMVTMTLLQGVINAFVMFLARIIAFAIARSGNEREGGAMSFLGYYAVTFILEAVFMLIGSMIVAAFSRWREYRADAGGAFLAGKSQMVSALEALKRTYEIRDPHESEQSNFQAFKISSASPFMLLFASHPPLDKRISALKRNQHPGL